jgi:tetratricopeptide (TPR) repeat protein
MADISGGSHMSDATNSPYPGLRPFVPTEQGRFFGRAEEIDILSQWWRDNRLVYLTGQAGRGKTSLVEAGIRPYLTSQRIPVLPTGRLHDYEPFPILALPEYNPYSLALLRSWSPADSPTRLAGMSIVDFVHQASRGGTVLAAIDASDDIILATGSRRFHRQRFLAELREALEKEPGLHLLIVGRQEGIDLAAHVLGNGLRYELGPLSSDAATEAVSEPLAEASRSLSDDASGRLIAELRSMDTDSIEPVLLQVVCANLWDALPPGPRQITARDVRAYGDVDGALAAFCGRIIAEVADDRDLPVGQLHGRLAAAFVAKTGGAVSAEVLRDLEDRHLLVARRQSGASRYELLSDRLIEPLRDAPDLHPALVRPEDLLRRAIRAWWAGELDRAEYCAFEVLRPELKPPIRVLADAQALLGNVFFERDKLMDAEPRFRKAAELYAALEDNKSVAVYLAAVGLTLLAHGRPADAVRELYSAVTRLPGDPVLSTELAQALWQDDKGAAAVAVLNDVLRMDGRNRGALRARGEILAFIGEPRQAMLDLDRVTQADGPQVRAARGLALAELGDERSARREIESALADGPRNGQVLLAAARVFHTAGDELSAREFAQQAADATDPPLPPSHREMARRLVTR